MGQARFSFFVSLKWILMPDLKQSLQGLDIGHLRIIARLWGTELTASDTDASIEQLERLINNPNQVTEVLETLPIEAQSALDALLEGEGRMPWVAFVRRFGEIREMGAGRRDRESPHLNPVSAAETLYYHALLARAFFDTPNGPQEFAYIPDDLLKSIKHERYQELQGNPVEPFVPVVLKDSEPLGRLASPGEKAFVIPSGDRILDDACTLLAALRLGMEPPPLTIPRGILLELLSAARLLRDSIPQPEPVKTFLEMPRSQALNTLFDAWQASETFNELRQVPGLACEGEWKNQPRVTREFLLELLSAIPTDKWWSLPAFLRAVKEKYPDFQRPAGDYDSWFIKRQSDGEYLRGFAHWDEVDGAFIRYFITGILFWLGMIDLACAEEGGTPTAFRILEDEKPAAPNENGKLTVASNGRISVPRLVPRTTRYQIARFCEWEDDGRVAAGSRYIPSGLLEQRRIAKSPQGETTPDEYRYRVTPASLTRARQQRLKPDQLLALLHKHAAAPLPPPFVRAIQRWELNGTEARIENPVVLRVSKPEVLEELRKSKAGRFLGEILGPTAVVIKGDASSKVLAALAEMGMLAEEIYEG